MKIATNKLFDLYKFWQTELSSIYDEGELYAIFELACEHYLGYTKSDTKQKFKENLNQSDVLKLYDTAKALKKGEPVQYIFGLAHFYGLIFKVTHDTLIPRPETEELVHLIIKHHQSSDETKLNILDIGTGSGCIPITLKKNFNKAQVSAVDVSEKALEIARSNAEKNQTNVIFINLDILSTSQISNSPFNIIISNPPYVLMSEAKHMDMRVLDYEPHLALFVKDNDPIIFYKRIIDLCKDQLSHKGCLYFELNPMYAEAVKEYAVNSKLFYHVELLHDMSNKQRFLKAQKI